MKIDPGTNYFFTNQPTQSLATNASTNTASASRSEPVETKQADFSNMTNQEMRGWINDHIRNGEISLDDSRAFMAITMKIPVNNGTRSELLAVNDGERFNFMQKAQDGIAGALSRNDKETLKMLESAMSVMQKYQGQTIGIDTRA